jgi:rare lipoprotein A
MRRLSPKALRIGALFFLMLVASAGLQAPVPGAFTLSGKPIKTWTGTASWYGPGFHGRTTASGQPYDMYAATAAHPSLPLGSVVRVVNLKTGESQLALINDRGPYFGGRELDVSYMLASRLGILEPGTASVRIELLEQPRRRLQTP